MNFSNHFLEARKKCEVTENPLHAYKLVEICFPPSPQSASTMLGWCWTQNSSRGLWATPLPSSSCSPSSPAVRCSERTGGRAVVNKSVLDRGDTVTDSHPISSSRRYPATVWNCAMAVSPKEVGSGRIVLGGRSAWTETGKVRPLPRRGPIAVVSCQSPSDRARRCHPALLQSVEKLDVARNGGNKLYFIFWE